MKTRDMVFLREYGRRIDFRLHTVDVQAWEPRAVTTSVAPRSAQTAPNR
jgi:hypothetical protein